MKAAIILFFAFLTLLVLILGVIGMATGGEFNKKFGNKLMIARVMFQATAILLLALFFFN